MQHAKLLLVVDHMSDSMPRTDCWRVRPAMVDDNFDDNRDDSCAAQYGPDRRKIGPIVPGHGSCPLLAVWGSGVRVPLAPLHKRRSERCCAVKWALLGGNFDDSGLVSCLDGDPNTEQGDLRIQRVACGCTHLPRPAATRRPRPKKDSTQFPWRSRKHSSPNWPPRIGVLSLAMPQFQRAKPA